MQLERDPQEQRNIERVVMCLKRAGRGAAGDGMQRGPFDFDVALAGQRLANRMNDPRAVDKSIDGPVGVDQIEVALALPLLGVGQPVVLVGVRLKRLGQEIQLRDKDRQLASAGVLELSLDAHDIAQVEAFGTPSFPHRSATCR